MDETFIVEANKDLGSLLDHVKKGEEVVITEQGKPVARLIPVTVEHDIERAKAAAGRILERSKRMSLGGLKIRDLIHEGHKY